MRPIPSRPSEVERLAKKLGFEWSGGSGSHRVYKHPDGRRTTIAINKKDVKIGTLRQIIFDLGISIEEFNESV